jgi:hypothetical protein
MIINPYAFPSGGGGFSPTDVSGLQLWLKADAITGLSDGDPVASWVDSSGNSRPAAQSTAGYRPLYKTSILNSNPVVRFDGSDDFLVTGGESYAIQTVFAVFKYTANPTYLGVFTGRPSSAIGSGSSDGNYGFTTLPLAGGDKVCSTNSVSSGGSGAHNYCATDGVSLDPDNFDNYNTGVACTQNAFHVFCCIRTTASSGGAKYLHVGVDPAISGRFLQGDVAEVVVYDSDIGATHRGQVVGYLGAKYGISV